VRGFILAAMCGRYGRYSRKERIEQVLGVTLNGGDEMSVLYNVCPGTKDWVIRQPLDASRPVMMQYERGLLPFWAKSAKGVPRPVNARAETVADKPIFRKLIRERRCLVPADGYYEWKTTSSGKHLIGDMAYAAAPLLGWCRRSKSSRTFQSGTKPSVRVARSAAAASSSMPSKIGTRVPTPSIYTPRAARRTKGSSSIDPRILIAPAVG
jgi:hypothetical protein